MTPDDLLQDNSRASGSRSSRDDLTSIRYAMEADARVVQSPSPMHAWQANLDAKASLAARYKRDQEFRRRLPSGHAPRGSGCTIGAPFGMCCICVLPSSSTEGCCLRLLMAELSRQAVIVVEDRQTCTSQVPTCMHGADMQKGLN